MRASGSRHGVLGLPPLLALARERGLDGDTLLVRARIPPELLADPHASVPVERVHALVRALIDATGDDALGLDAGRHYHLATFGLLGAVASVTPTARDVIRLFVDYVHLTYTFFLIDLDERGDDARLVFVADGDLGPLHRFYLDREQAFIYWIARELWPATHQSLISAVDFDYPEPPEAPRYRALFGVRVCFDAPEAGVEVDFGGDPARGQGNPLGLAMLTDHLRLFAGSAGPDIVACVRRELTIAVARRRTLPSIDAVAAGLGTSERVLRRRLTAEGTSFRRVADDVLAPMARRFLRRTTLTVADIAERLGYAEAASFVRAFRRWTGTTPEAFRRGG